MYTPNMVENHRGARLISQSNAANEVQKANRMTAGPLRACIFSVNVFSPVSSCVRLPRKYQTDRPTQMAKYRMLRNTNQPGCNQRVFSSQMSALTPKSVEYDGSSHL